MKKYLKIIKKLTNKVGGSLPFLKNGAENLLVIGELEDLIGKSLTSIESWVGTVGLITVPSPKPARWSIGMGLNFPIISEAKI